MSTIDARSYALLKQKKIDVLPTKEQRIEIGKIVIKKYRELTGGKKPARIPANKIMGDFLVCYYPAFFTGEVDKSILHLMAGKKERWKPLNKQQ
jgi:hypothetical protein